MDAVTKENIAKIKNIENDYGLLLFKMGLTHLFDAGHQHFSYGNVEDDMAQIIVEGEEDKAKGVHPIITPELKCKIIKCSSELANFSIWTLLTYVKNHMDISN